ncbi:MAG: FMN-binding glutamate synthase family protein [Pseudomonadales bacterium]
MTTQDMSWFRELALVIVSWSAVLFLAAVGCLAFYILVLYIKDSRQHEHTLLHNYPVIGRFRYMFEHMGEFFRQYFFAQDREELPFNRALRSWVYRAAKNVDRTLAFGSTRPLNQPGEIIFLNCLFPTLNEEIQDSAPITLGRGYVRTPYTANSFFNISGMSYGALSAPAVEALSLGAKKAGVWMNTGEGGLSEYHLKGGCDIVFQIGTAKYGVRDENGKLSDKRLKELAEIEQVRMFEIKLSQGAKPGKGGMLPGDKVSAEIACIRGIPQGEDSISPNGHSEVRNLDTLLDMIQHVREVTGKPVGFKAVIGQSAWLDELMVNIHRRGLDAAPDFITIDSADGGTGAAPQALMDFVGLPIQRSLPLVVDKLNEYGLRERIKIITSGKLITPSSVAWALTVGADFVVTARGFMFALGCIQALQCNKNSCPTGITTHNPELQKGLHPELKSVRVQNYAENMRHDVAMLAHSCGLQEPRQLNRSHAQIINDRGIPEPLEQTYPMIATREEYIIGRSQN